MSLVPPWLYDYKYSGMPALTVKELKRMEELGGANPIQEHVDYGVRTGKGITWCREGGREQAIEHIRNRRLGGFSAELVTRTRTDWMTADE